MLSNYLVLCIHNSTSFQIVRGVEWTPFSFYSRSVLRISAEEGGNYTCQVHSEHNIKTHSVLFVAIHLLSSYPFYPSLLSPPASSLMNDQFSRP